MAVIEMFSSAGHLLSLSDEIVLTIVDNIDSPGDLVAFTLTCRRLHRIISPSDAETLGQLKCRHLSLSIKDVGVLSTLSSAALAKHVRKLRLRGIGPPSPLRPSSGLIHEDYEPFWTFSPPIGISEYNAALINATLCKLSNLRVLILDDLHLRPHDALFRDVATYCPLLEKVSLHVYRNQSVVIHEGGTQDPGDEFRQIFDGLTRLSVIDVYYEATWIVPSAVTNNILCRISDFIFQSYCRLRCLSLFIPHLPDAEHLRLLHFPVLRSFNLRLKSDDYAYVPSETTRVWLASFLLQHRTLEDVRIHDWRVWRVERFALPNLRRLISLPEDVMSVLSPIAEGKYRPLQWLRIDPTRFSPLWSYDLGNFTTLKVLQIVCEDVQTVLMDLPELPNLGLLAFSLTPQRQFPNTCSSYMGLSGLDRVDFWSMSFPSLHCLKGVFVHAMIYYFFKDADILDSPGSYTRVLRRLGKCFPKLQVVDRWRRSEGSSSWAIDPNEQSDLVWPPFDEEWEDPCSWTYRVR